MTQEALKLSQEALAGLKDVEKQVRELVAENKALKETLAQTQEPVAMWDGKYQIEFGNLSAYKHGEHSWIPLYTTPPQRTWVELTDETISEIAINNPPMVHEFARAIEAKLKEKNTNGQA